MERRQFLVLVAGLTAFATVRAQDSKSKNPQFSCSNVSGLSPEQIQTRKSLQYTDRSSKAKQTCGNCQNLQPKPQGSDGCQGCQVIPGPVHPSGWCSAWVARPS